MFLLLSLHAKSDVGYKIETEGCGKLTLKDKEIKEFKIDSNKIYITTQKFFMTGKLEYQYTGENETHTMKSDTNYIFEKDFKLIHSPYLGGRTTLYYWTVPNDEPCEGYAYSIIDQKKVIVQENVLNLTVPRCYMFSNLFDTNISIKNPEPSNHTVRKNFYIRSEGSGKLGFVVKTVNQHYGAFNVSITRFDNENETDQIWIHAADNLTWWVWTAMFGSAGVIYFIFILCMFRRPNSDKEYIYYWGPNQSSLTQSLLGEM